MSPLLSVENLQVQFRLRKGFLTAVDDFSLEVNEGECVGIVGESGCGKSTTGFAIMRLLPGNGHVSGGRIVMDGKDIASYSERQMRSVRGEKIALIPQDPLNSLNPTTKIGRQIAEGLMIHTGASYDKAKQRALEVLELVEMPRPKERLSQYPFELSGGLRQRVIIAMGLVCNPKLLIADEPTTALDVTIQAQILDLIDHLRADLKMAVILITHDMGVIAGRADRVVVMYAGKKAEEAKTELLFNEMRHPYSQALLASVPSIEFANKVRLRSIEGLPPDLSKTIVGCRFAIRCAYATDQCRTTEPPFVIGEDAHGFACFHPVSGKLELADVEPVAPGATPVPAAPARPAVQSTSSDGNENLVRIENLVKRFPIKGGSVFRHTIGAIQAVSDVTFEVREGETFGLVGESGCGKTTIGRLLIGLEDRTEGRIIFQGADVSEARSHDSRRLRRDRQMMFQDPFSSLNPRMKVAEIIREPLAIQKVGTKAEQRRAVSDLLLSVGLEPKAAERHPHEFSGGQRQRIGLARALALRPKLIVADEPVSALDVSIQAQILNLMKDLQHELNLTYLMISHDLAVVYYMADTIGVMYLGKLVEIGDAESVFRSPAHPYTQGLLDAVPVPDPVEARRRRGIQVQGELPSAANPPSGCRFRTRCPRAQELCAEVEPPLQSFGGRHEAACHFPLQTPVAITSSSAAAATD